MYRRPKKKTHVFRRWHRWFWSNDPTWTTLGPPSRVGDAHRRSILLGLDARRSGVEIHFQQANNLYPGELGWLRYHIWPRGLGWKKALPQMRGRGLVNWRVAARKARAWMRRLSSSVRRESSRRALSLRISDRPAFQWR